MALVKKIKKHTLERNQVHNDVDATYTVFTDEKGKRYLQIDTYGSKNREIPGKKSQSVQFGPEGIRELKKLLENL